MPVAEPAFGVALQVSAAVTFAGDGIPTKIVMLPPRMFVASGIWKVQGTVTRPLQNPVVVIVIVPRPLPEPE